MSPATRLLHCSVICLACSLWPSSNPIYSSNGIKECYWTVDKFIGWHVGYAGVGESEYTYKLSKMGF